MFRWGHVFFFACDKTCNYINVIEAALIKKDLSYSQKYSSSRQKDISPLNSQYLTVGFAEILALCVVKPCTMVGLWWLVGGRTACNLRGLSVLEVYGEMTHRWKYVGNSYRVELVFKDLVSTDTQSTVLDFKHSPRSEYCSLSSG